MRSWFLDRNQTRHERKTGRAAASECSLYQREYVAEQGIAGGSAQTAWLKASRLARLIEIVRLNELGIRI
jgi:hypothetical protein